MGLGLYGGLGVGGCMGLVEDVWGLDESYLGATEGCLEAIGG